jgi:proline dehydrogenase
MAREIPTSTVLRDFIFWLSTKPTLTEAIARRGMRWGFARRFVAGETLDDAIHAGEKLGRAGQRVLLNHLGENVATAEEARHACDTYIEILQRINQAGIGGNIAIKLTQLGLDRDHPTCLSLTGEIARAAAAVSRTIEIDMEGSSYTERTLEVFETTQRRHGDVGIAIQAYLRRSEGDVKRLAPLAPKIRLVKGAYREPASIAFQSKTEVDASYRRLLDRMLRPNSDGRIFPAIATHDTALIHYAREKIEEYGLAPDQYEFQMLFGIRRDLQQELRVGGYPLRVYIPFGTAWCPYFMRRLAERPANVGFLLRSLFAEHGHSSV